MNYIKHLTGFFDKVQEEEGLTSSHLALYMALFQLWNKQRFKQPMVVVREEVMLLSKITSRGTYHRGLKALNDHRLIQYYPSKNPLKGSTVYMVEFGTSTGLKNEQGNDQEMEPFNQTRKETNQTIKNEGTSSGLEKRKEGFVVPELGAVITYFEEKGSTGTEAEKFYHYFESNGWLVGGKAKMKKWEAAASHWMLNAKKFNAKSGSTGSKLFSTSDRKRYDEPL